MVLVPHGYGSRDIRTLDADRIVADADELRAAIIALTGLQRRPDQRFG